MLYGIIYALAEVCALRSAAAAEQWWELSATMLYVYHTNDDSSIVNPFLSRNNERRGWQAQAPYYAHRLELNEECSRSTCLMHINYYYYYYKSHNYPACVWVVKPVLLITAAWGDTRFGLARARHTHMYGNFGRRKSIKTANMEDTYIFYQL